MSLNGFLYLDDHELSRAQASAVRRWREHLGLPGRLVGILDYQPRRRAASLALLWIDGKVSYEAIDRHVEHRYLMQLGVM